MSRLALAILLSLSLAGSPTLATEAQAQLGSTVSLVLETGSLGKRLIEPALLLSSVYAREAYPQAFHKLAVSRVIPMGYEQRENLSFGPWEAPRAIGADKASDEGLLTEWAPRYYITHDWSEYGQQIRQMIPGDAVVINGRGILISDIFDYPREGYLEEIREVVGPDVIVLQTCEPDTPNNRIVYGTISE